MAWLRWFVLGVGVGVVVLFGWQRWQAGEPGLVIAFAGQFDQASLWRPSKEVFTSRTATLANTTYPVIAAKGPSRIAWDLTVPRHAWIEAHIGVDTTNAAAQGDGILFRIGLSAEGRYDELVTRVVNPQTTPADRAWVPVTIDLSAYAGQQASVIFNTAPAGADSDAVALWADPRMVVR